MPNTATNQPMPQSNSASSFSRAELLQASVELRHHALAYVKSMALRCAVKLGVADAIHRRGGWASLEDLLSELSLDASRLPCLRAVMRALAASGVFAEGSDGEYRLTAVSSLLVDDGSGRGSLSPATLLFVAPPFVTPVVNLAEWVLAGSGGDSAATTTAFEMTHGGDVWGVLGRDAALCEFFNGALASDTRFVMDMAIRGSPKVFEGLASLVDVAGGAGAAARAVAAAFPRIKCTVLDLPQVIDALAPVDGMVDYVTGDMMEFIPPADAVLLKNVLHDWSDQECVNILKRCKEAIPFKEARGKVIVIDVVLGSSPLAICSETQLWLDLLMLTITTGKERKEKEWRQLFNEAGFSDYKIRPVLGLLSIIEFVLYDWSDEDCVNILKRCKDAIVCGEHRGKVIIIDVVVDSSSSRATCHETQPLFDLFISMLTQGRKRDEREWCRLLKEAGLSDYKVTSVLDIRSVIEVFP